MTGTTLEPVLDATNVDDSWQWSLVEVAPGILDELLDQLKPIDSTSNIGGLSADQPACYLKSAPSWESTHHSRRLEGFGFVALPEVPLPALCTDNHVLGLKQRRLEHLSHLVIRPLTSARSLDQLDLDHKENTMANAPLFLPLRPVITSSTLSDRESSSPYFIVSNVRCTLLGAVVPADYNLLFQFMNDETERRFRIYALGKEHGSSSDEFEGFRVKEFLTSSIRIPQKVAENEMFRQYPLICLPRRSRDSDFVVIPLDEEKDLAVIAMKFFPLLEAHIKKVFEDSGRETVSEFSFFTALYILSCAVDESEFAFSALLSGNAAQRADGSPASYPSGNMDKDKLADYNVVRDKAISKTSEWIRDPFVACQVLRFLVTSVRNGFDCIIPTTGSTPTSGDPDYMTALCRLESTCREMSITQRTGFRMGINELKVYYLLTLLKLGSKEISPQTLMKLSYGSGSKDKLSPASLFPFQSHVQLRIAPLAATLKECRELFASLFQYYRAPDIAGAMANARSKITVGTIPDKWYFWNWNIGMFGEVTKSIITGQLGLKQVPETIGVMDREIAMLLALLGGKAFSLELPESVFASISPETHLSSNATKQASYIVFCDARSLSWNWETRLKDLYRMKRLWPLVELREYIGPLLEHDTSLSLDRVIATYLEPHPTLSGYYQNSSLHLERP